MQNRFKFRFWFKDTQEMIYSEKFNDVQTLGQWLFEDRKDVVKMQSTGLKDKNGKLIYDGDVVNVYVSSEKLYRYQVKFEIGSFMLVSNEEIFDFPNKWNDNVYPLSQLYFKYENEDYCIEQVEVIGNIYENKELLNEI